MSAFKSRILIGKRSGQANVNLLITTPPSGAMGGGLLTTVKTSPLGVLTTTTNLPSSGGLVSPAASVSAVLDAGGVGGTAKASAAASAAAKLDANIIPARPLFDKTNAATVKLRRDVKTQKMKGWPIYKIDLIRTTLPVPPEITFGTEDWLPNDDFVILYVI